MYLIYVLDFVLLYQHHELIVLLLSPLLLGRSDHLDLILERNAATAIHVAHHRLLEQLLLIRCRVVIILHEWERLLLLLLTWCVSSCANSIQISRIVFVSIGFSFKHAFLLVCSNLLMALSSFIHSFWLEATRGIRLILHISGRHHGLIYFKRLTYSVSRHGGMENVITSSEGWSITFFTLNMNCRVAENHSSSFNLLWSHW